MILDNIGNIREEYEHKQRTARIRGIVETPRLCLKVYSMAKDLHPTEKTMRKTYQLLKEHIDKGKISPLIGLGFAILSEDILNVARWDDEYPIVLKNQLYGFDRSIKSAKPLDITDVGTFCIWELGIVNHEKEAWKKFLESTRRWFHKKEYLENFIQGKL